MQTRLLLMLILVLIGFSAIGWAAYASEQDGISLVVRGGTTKDLAFCITVMSGPLVEVRSLRVASSTVDPFWVVLPAGGRESVSVKGCIRYGEIPLGFGGTTAYPLLPARYFVTVVLANGDARRAQFTLKQDGAIDVGKTDP